MMKAVGVVEIDRPDFDLFDAFNIRSAKRIFLPRKPAHIIARRQCLTHLRHALTPRRSHNRYQCHDLSPFCFGRQNKPKSGRARPAILIAATLAKRRVAPVAGLRQTRP